ncbi:LysM peptidoglycan-binding domain-containing protein [Macrococcus carouselicus]|uniref:LysM peptidoglycan-binding domain-containing protein n=1 Tax=Macrococcus carouselicus TaxID=69969 RepID=A0A9Q8CJC4_9STAP|nr:LysM peptidoglycan-binding domain-containing protein [Macrococcus carouselicus]TDL95385.1 LysM peptidoglycan-binding domain-containing protein [Macrococcus carouselicus]
MKKALAVTTAVAAAGSFAATADAAEYTVNSGDTLWNISQQYGTSVASIKAENGLSSDLIFPKQVLKVNEKAAPSKGPAQTTVYNIVAGDTLGQIAAKFNVTVAQLKAWNNLSSDLIIAGKTLYVSGPSASVQQPAVHYNTPVQQAPVQKTAPVKTYQAPVQQAPVQKAAPVKTYQAPVQQQTYQAPKAATTQTAATHTGGANWAALAACESGGNPSIVDASGTYHGLYQFDAQTWRSVGGSGVASQASAAEQTMRAKILYSQRGSQPWPVCGARL